MRIVVLAALSAATAMIPHAATIGSPPGSINSDTPTPFLVTTDFTQSVQYQQVYGAEDFAREGSPAYLITEISFAGSAAPVIIPNVQIYFSTTQASVDSLSPVFANNLGPNNTLVYSGRIDWTTGSGGSFAFRIPLQQAFRYDWSVGNLLMEVRNYQTVPPLPFPQQRLFMAVNTLGDTVSYAVAYDVNASSAEFLGTRGLLTLFTVTGVPEPSAAWLLVSGLSALAVLARSRHRGNAPANIDAPETR
jgi:hypothetical protein